MRFRAPASLAAALLGLALALAPAAAAERTAYLSGLEDVPLMAGLVEAEGLGMSFDDPAGRIVENFATGRVAREAVLAFYAATLPQLGWTAGPEGVFRREGEELRIEFPAGGEETTVRFYLAPR